MAEKGAPAVTQLRLYVAGSAPNSVQAKHNLNAVLSHIASDVYELEVIDCLEEPVRTLTDGIVVTPTLLKLAPEPRTTVIGTLGDAESLRRSIGL
jgi:circadian clock protein KaiB